MVLYRPDGEQMTDEDWQNPLSKTLAVALDGRQIADEDGETSRDRFLLLLNAHDEAVDFTIPTGGTSWAVVLTTDEPTEIGPLRQHDVLAVRDRSLLLLHST